MRTLIVYAFHELNENVRFFTEKGYIDDSRYHFVFVANDPHLQVDMLFARTRQRRADNVQLWTRENVGHDFGAWAYGVSRLMDPHRFDYVVLVNSSVMGPFLPVWHVGVPWPDLFTQRLSSSVKLVGTTIGLFEGRPHVQSMLLAMDHVGLRLAMDQGILEAHPVARSKNDIILQKEVGLSTALLAAGYNIACLMPLMGDVDFRDPAAYKQFPASFNVLPPRQYYGICLNPYEVLFVKNNACCSDRMVVSMYKRWHRKQRALPDLIRQVVYMSHDGRETDVTDAAKAALLKHELADMDCKTLLGTCIQPPGRLLLFLNVDGAAEPVVLKEDQRGKLRCTLLVFGS